MRAWPLDMLWHNRRIANNNISSSSSSNNNERRKTKVLIKTPQSVMQGPEASASYFLGVLLQTVVGPDFRLIIVIDKTNGTDICIAHEKKH